MHWREGKGQHPAGTTCPLSGPLQAFFLPFRCKVPSSYTSIATSSSEAKRWMGWMSVLQCRPGSSDAHFVSL